MIYLWFLCWWYKYKVLHKLKYLMPIFQSLAAPLVLRKDTLIPIKTGYQKVRLSHEKDVLRPIGLSLAAPLVLQKDINEPIGKDPISNFRLSCEKDSIIQNSAHFHKGSDCPMKRTPIGLSSAARVVPERFWLPLRALFP